MNRSITIFALAGLVAVLSTGCADRPPLHAGGGPSQGHMMHGRMMGATSSAGSQQMQHSMMGGMHQMHSMQMSGDVDKDFVRMMRMHHVQGIEMARIELQKGDDAQAKQMAQKIIDQQSKEVAEFDRWLQRNQ
jgi:uncharacterized protein (DUF305 family)